MIALPTFRGCLSGFSPLSLGPLAYFDLANSNCYGGSGVTLTDLSGNGNNGTLTGGATYATTNGGIINLNGSNGYINIAAIASGQKLSGKSQYSFCAFLKHLNAGSGFFSYATTSEFTNDILNFSASGINCAQVNNGSDGEGTVTRTYSANYYHVAVVFDGSQTGNSARLKMYINGVLQTLTYTYTVPATTGSPPSPQCWIGSYVASPGAWWMNGSIASSLVFDKALTAANILSIFNHGRSRLGI